MIGRNIRRQWLGALLLASVTALGIARPGVAAPAVAMSTAAWPHTLATERGSAVVYQPQALSWPDLATLNARMAVGITPTGSKTTTLGTIDVAFATRSDLADRTVVLSAPKLTAASFPAADAQQAARFEQGIAAALAKMGDKRVPLDSIVLSLNGPQRTPRNTPIATTPPTIFYSSRAASLLLFDGEPVLAPVTGSGLSVAVNTNWDVFVADASKQWYWLNNGGWLTSSAFKGPWSPVTRLPAAFAQLPSDNNYAAVRKQIPGHPIKASELPTIFVSTSPAEIIVTSGPPKLTAIAGTSLRFVANTNANLFVDSANGKYYYLTAGRWYSAANLEGPWTYATATLPADFKRIPRSGPRGSVLTFVPGTPEAQAAVLMAEIPTQASLARDTTRIDVVYSGPPKFEPIAGTTMTYAVNTMYDVIGVASTYYTCYQGAWFVSSSPSGPWALAESVPKVIYTIPPTNPLYRVTYVEVYGSTPTAVTYGYTAGYSMGYVYDGVVVYGTGYYYPPVIWPAPIPIYYPYPYTFTGTTWYNPATGAWARGGTIYGPYGGAAKGGTAYNPATGAWAHGGAVYGPNGGAGAWSAYNPSTGGYAHGSASWGTNSGTANANWYNGRTGITGSTNQNYNAYGSWGSSSFSGASKTVNTQHQSNANGTAGSFRSSTGAEGAGAKGANGNSAGIAKGSGGNVYAGANGNVYRHTDNGWSKWNDGSWNPVTPPDKGHSGSNLSGQTRDTSGNLSGATRQSGDNLSGATRQSGQNLSGATQQSGQNLSGATRQSGQNLSGATERGGRFRGGAMEPGQYQQLETDRQARTQGFERAGRAAAGGRRR